MLKDELAKVRRVSTNIAERLVVEREAALLDKIAKLEERVKKLERAPKAEPKTYGGKTDAKL